jgi:hypothetical protein
LKLHSIFLRDTCILPNDLDVLIEPFRAGWTHVQRIESCGFDATIRYAHWHFMWVQESYSRRGVGSTEETAIYKALASALLSVSIRFNAAEFDSLHVSRVPGFYIANVTMYARHIQEDASLEMAAESYLQSTR